MFKENDTICFFGDSITADGRWIAEVYQNLHSKKIKCYNCGVPGATAFDSHPRLHSHCLIHNPDYVVVMYGMNDITREMYSPDCPHPEKDKIKADSLDRNREYMELIVNDCIVHGATPILCTPTPCDEINDKEAKNLYCNGGLAKCGENVKKLAEKYGCPIVDFQRELLNLITQMDIIGPDRVHPNELGHHVLAQIFMKFFGIIDTVDFNSAFKMEDWNAKRYAVEQKLARLNFVDYCILEKIDRQRKLTLSERKAEVQKKYDECETKVGFIPECYLNYINNIDFKENFLAELVKCTI